MFNSYGASLLSLLFVTAAAVAWIATIPMRRIALRIGCVDHPSERKLHERATPRLGGLAIVLGFSLPLLAGLTNPVVAQLVRKNINYLYAVLISGALILALGLYDDLVGSDAWKKFAVQTAAAIVVVAFDLHFDVVFVPGFGALELGWFGIILTIVWIVGVINAVNFIDGMDGLATLVFLTTAVAMAVIAFIVGDAFTLVIMIALAGSLLGFYPWNRRPATIFMGDTGSLFLGLILATCSLARGGKAPTALMIGGPMLALALPVLDTLFVMQGRLSGSGSTLADRFRRLVNADRTHLHHVLAEKFGSEGIAITRIWHMTFLFSVAAILTVVPALKSFGYLLASAALLLLLVARTTRARSEAHPLKAHPVRRRTDAIAAAGGLTEPTATPLRKPAKPAIAFQPSPDRRQA